MSKSIKDLTKSAVINPDYIALLTLFKDKKCMYNSYEKHQHCKDVNKSGRLRRNPTKVREWHVRHRFESGVGPSNLEVDHIVPLCLGGPDCICNFQYLTIAQHKRKTKNDIKACRMFDVRL